MSRMKQVIVMRKDLKMRRGKEVAQGSHASTAFLSQAYCSGEELGWEVANWLTGHMTKICVRVNSEQELVEIFNKGREAGLKCHMITDEGVTEFGGVYTKTCLAIGPDYASEVDKITGHLELY